MCKRQHNVRRNPSRCAAGSRALLPETCSRRLVGTPASGVFLGGSKALMMVTA